MTVKAGYRFVPIEPDLVIAPPIPYAALDLSKPNAEGSVSGSLDVTWTAETPICIGIDDPAQQTPGQPKSLVAVKFGNRHCLPGASLRSMTRAVTESATFSHLGRINAGRHHGVRTWAQNEFPKYFRPAQGDRLSFKAGWLTWSPTGGRGTWTLTAATTAVGPHGYAVLPFDQILAYLAAHPTIGRAAPDAQTWCLLSVEKKMDLLGSGGLESRRSLSFNGDYNRQVPGVQRVVFASSTHAPHCEGYIVCAGADADLTKHYEAVFGAPDSTQRWAIRDETMDLFHGLHSKPGRTVRDPHEPWRWWLARTDYFAAFELQRAPTDSAAWATTLPRCGLGIPVFFCGDPSFQDPAAPSRNDFFISLSRVPRLPWRTSVGEMAQRLYRKKGAAPAPYKIPRLGVGPYGWDFARALYGEVEDDTLHDMAAANLDAKGQPETAALKGRVAFGPAFEESPPNLTEDKTGVFGQPRESFYPFYLTKDPREAVGPATYDDNAVPAGRKRYVVRRVPSRFASGNENLDMLTTIRLLPAGSRFRGCIRFHNLHPVELGALLWSLTFGQPGGPHRHMIGRAKGYGHGVLRPEVSIRDRIDMRNIASEAQMHVGDGTRQVTIGGFIGCFEAYMRAEIAPKDTGDTLDKTWEALRACANPATGDRNAASVAYGELEEYQVWKNGRPGRPGRSPLPRFPMNVPAGRRTLLPDLDEPGA